MVAAGHAGSFQGGSTGALIFAFGGSTYVPGEAADMLVGVGGALTASTGIGGGLLAGASGGGNRLAAGGGDTTLFGAGSGDVLTASGTAAGVLVAGGGAETLTAAGGSGPALLFAGAGDDRIETGGGPAAVVIGAGHDAIALGTGAAVLVLQPGAGIATVTGWDSGRDWIDVIGGGSAADAFAGAQLVNGSTVISLGAGGGTITLVGVTQLQPYSVLS